MQSVSQPWLVLLLGGSPLQLGTVLALQFAPAMVLAPLGGVLADRVDKRKVLMVAQVGAMAQAIVLFGLTVTGVVRDLARHGAGHGARLRQRGRDAGAAGVRRRAGAAPRPGERHRAEQRQLQPGPRHRSGGRRPGARLLRAGLQLRHQRGELPGRPAGPVADEPGGAEPPGTTRCADRSGCPASRRATGRVRLGAQQPGRGAALCPPHADRPLAAGAAGRHGHLRA